MSLRALVTGAAGFVGANLAGRLLAEGAETHLLVRPGSDLWRLGDCRAAVVHEVDLCHSPAVAEVVSRVRPDWIFHLAAHGAYSSQTDLERMVAVNLTATARLLESCRPCGFRAFIQAGSSSEYGLQDHPPTEDERPEPNSTYAVTKLAAAHFSRQLAIRHRLPVRILRLYSVYGPWEDPSRLMPTLVRHALHGRLPPLVHPQTARDFVFIGDALDAFLLAARAESLAPGEIFNIGSGTQTSLQELVETCRALFDIAEEPQWATMPNRIWDTTRWIADPRKAARELRWSASTPLSAGLRQLAAWFREHPDIAARYESS